MRKKKRWVNIEPMPEQIPVDYDTRKILHSEYTEYRSQIIGLRAQLHQTYDKALLTISTGSIVVSFTYIVQVDGIDYHRNLWMMIVSWVLYCISIILGLYGHRISCKSNDDSLRIADLNFDNKTGNLGQNGWDELCKLKHQKDIFGRRIYRVNNAQLVILPLGMVFFALFVFISLGSSKPHKPDKTIYYYKEECMSPEEKTKNGHVIKKIKKSILNEQAIVTHDEPRSSLPEPKGKDSNNKSKESSHQDNSKDTNE